MTGPRILTLDIETSPHKVWTFNTYKAYIAPIQIIDPTRVICWAAKWHGEHGVLFGSEYHNDRSGTYYLRRMWNLLDQADVVVTYNGDHFDIPHLNREFQSRDWGVPSSYVSVDLYKVIKRHQVWASHKLAYLTERLGLSGKIDNGGMQTWLDLLQDEDLELQRKAWNKMRLYNKRDVVTTEELFDEVRHLVSNIPHVSLFSETKHDRPACPQCESENVSQQGWRRTKTRRYPRYQCQDCAKWFSDSKSDMGVSGS